MYNNKSIVYVKSLGFKMTLKKVWFDLDGVLVCSPQKEYPAEQATHYLSHFGKAYMPIEAGEPHYVFPGVIELFRYLLQRKDIEFGFFSAASNTRNIPLVQLLMQEVDSDQKNHPKLQIKSWRDQSYEPAPSGAGFTLKKNIKFAHTEGEEPIDLENSLLIDDSAWNAASGQESNLLLSPSVRHYYFNELTEPELENSVEGWKMTYMQYVNHIFYLTGILDYCLEEAKTTTLKEALGSLRSDQPFPLCMIHHWKDMNWYHRGLNVLRQFNPSLEFNSFGRMQDILTITSMESLETQVTVTEEHSPIEQDSVYASGNVFFQSEASSHTSISPAFSRLETNFHG